MFRKKRPIAENADVLEEEQVRWRDLYFEEYLAAGCMLVIVGSVLWGVITRYVLAQPAQWAPEVASIAFAWAVFIGAAAAFKLGAHSSVDIMLNLLPARARGVMQLAVDGFCFAALISIAYLSAVFTVNAHDAPTTILRLPQSVIYGSAALGFALMAVRHLMASVNRLNFRRTQG